MESWKLNTAAQAQELREIVFYVKPLYAKICKTQVVTDIEKRLVLNWLFEMEQRIAYLDALIIFDEILNK